MIYPNACCTFLLAQAMRIVYGRPNDAKVLFTRVTSRKILFFAIGPFSRHPMYSFPFFFMWTTHKHTKSTTSILDVRLNCADLKVTRLESLTYDARPC